jgi:hypothetical protein
MPRLIDPTPTIASLGQSRSEPQTIVGRECVRKFTICSTFRPRKEKFEICFARSTFRSLELVRLYGEVKKMISIGMPAVVLTASWKWVCLERNGKQW